ncbi:hypothetical protein HanIR_Chr12g0610761 [Helianthus annuus]|nr:hypothetical protein HanIR_Chr12g0610761 [Helianthus annuus]
MYSVHLESIIHEPSLLPAMFASGFTSSPLLDPEKNFTKELYWSSVNPGMGLALVSTHLAFGLAFSSFFPGHQSGYPINLEHPSRL